MRNIAPHAVGYSAACRLVAAVGIGASVLVATPARAGNADAVYLGSGATLQAGAITADILGGGAIWYNPAGLARMPGLRFDVSMNAYALRFGGHPDFDGGEGTTVERLQALDLNVVPSSLTVTRNFGKIGLGLGVFVPLQRTTFLRTQVIQPETAERPGVRFGVDSSDKVQEYTVGPGVGIPLHPAVDFGGSLFVNYRSILSTATVSERTTRSGVDTSSVTHGTVDAQQLGLQVVLGVKLRPSRHTNIGFTLRLPSFQFYELKQTIAQSASSDPSRPGISDFGGNVGFTSSVLSPARFHVGVSRDFGPTRIAGEFNYQSRLHDSGRDEDFLPTWNVRAGGKHTLSDTFAVGGGLFTDRSSAPTPRFFSESKIDYYGVTAALDFGTPYSVTSRGSTRLDPPGRMIFGTTIGLSYAIGFGQVVRGQVVGIPERSAATYQEVTSQVVAHEITLHIGSTLSE